MAVVRALVMFLKPGQSAAKREPMLYANSLLWQFFSKTDADWFDVTLDRAHHGRFSDWILLRSWEEQYMHPRLAHEIVNVLTREFLDKYLKGSGDTPFLSGTRSWPQVQVPRKPGEGST